jgi:hypothetical protein
MSGAEVAVGVTKKGLTPMLPQWAPLDLITIIQMCFAYQPAQRPAMQTLHNQLSNVQLAVD